MPALPNRDRFEDELTADLVLLLQHLAAATLDDPRWAHDEHAVYLSQALLVPKLIGIYKTAALHAARDAAIRLDHSALEFAAQQWAMETAASLAGRVISSVRANLASLEQEAARRGASLALVLLAALPDLFSPSRARGFAVTTTTGGTTAGERFSLGESGLLAIWALGRSKSGPCPLCEPLNGLREDEWPEYARGGPPLHPHCACHLLWA